MLSVAAALLFAAATAPCIHSFDAPRTAGFTVDFALSIADFDGDGRGDLLTYSAVYLDFSRRVPLPIGLVPNIPRRITDVNGDGRPDVLAIRTFDIVALVNKGDGTFTATTTPHPTLGPLGGYETSTSFGDFNHDGLLDVFVLGAPVYLARGDGTFQEENSVALSGQGNWIAADVDGDRLPDLIGASRFGTNELIFFHRRTNGFDTAQVWPAMGSLPLLAADFDRDGREDILFQGGSIVFGAGNTAPSRTAETPTGDGHVFAEDFNGDGAPDLLLSSTGGIQVLLNDGHGNIARSGWQLPSTGGMPGQIDGDGIVDLMVFDRGGEPIVLHGNGDGTFRVPRVALTHAASGVAADFDGDGDDDIAVPNAIAWNNGDNTFRVVVLAAVLPFAAADVDGDGIADVVTREPAAIRALRLRPDGSAVEVGRVGITNVLDATVGDFSGTHRAELAVLISGSPRLVQVFDFHNGAAARFTANPSGPGTPLSIAAGDLNGDGADDLVVTGGILVPPTIVSDPGWQDSLNGYVSTYVSTHATFEAERLTRYAEGDAVRTAALYEVLVGDIDGDGKADIAAATVPASRFYGSNRAGGRLIVFFGDGRGTFDRTQEKSLPIDVYYVVAATDFNGDGRQDVAVNGAFRLFLGTSGGLVEQPHYLAPTGASPALAVRPRPGALPSLVVPVFTSPDAFIYPPICVPARSRVVRH